MSSRNAQQGFVLAVVLWSIAGLTLITAGIMARVNATLEDAYRLNEMAQQQQHLMATEQTLLYLISARPMNPAGLDLSDSEQRTDPFAGVEIPAGSPVLRFDGQHYEGVGRARFAIQDGGAALSLREPQRSNWLRVMELLDVPVSQADTWLDQLQDYQDRDDLPRLSGAEAPTYREQGLPEPANRFMLSPHQLRNLPIARQSPEVAETLIALSTTGVGTNSNLNTAPPLMLQLLQGLSEDDARRLARERGDTVLSSLEQANERFGMLFQGGELGTIWQPSGNVRLMLSGAQGRHRRWISVKFTPNQGGRPWVIEYHHPVQLTEPGPEQESATTDDVTPARAPQAAGPATEWPHYQAFFPQQLPVER